MKKEYVLTWLNSRVNKPPLEFDHLDIVFIMNYIDHYKKKTVSLDTIISSLQRRPPNMILNHIGFMINKLIVDFNITTKTEKKTIMDPQYNLMSGAHPLQQQEVEIITEYT